MMSSDEIQRRQNDRKFLKIQYAAREHYNFAERLNNFAWMLCLVSAFFVFLPNNCPAFVSYGIPFAADIIALFLILLVNHRVTTAAKLRKYFDAHVLNICPDQFSETELREMKEIAEKVYSKNPQKAIIQMANTGKDLPPGVHDWYVFSQYYSGITAQFECQRQNTWWNSKMLHKRLVATICVVILVGIAFLILTINNDVMTVLLCSTGIIIKTVERLIENGKYIWLSNLIDGAQQAVEVHPTNEGIEKLQTLIDSRRTINILEFNWFHKKNAKQLSTLYENSVT